MAVKKSRKFPGFVIYTYLIDSVFTACQKGCKVLNYNWYVKGVPFVNGGYMKRVPVYQKMV